MLVCNCKLLNVIGLGLFYSGTTGTGRRLGSEGGVNWSWHEAGEPEVREGELEMAGGWGS